MTVQAHPSQRAVLLQRSARAPRILVPVDGSPLANAAVDHAVELARGLGGVVRFAHVVDPRRLLFDPSGPHASASMLVKAQRAQGERILRAAVERARTNGAACDSVLLQDAPARVSDLLIREADDWGATLVVMGSHGRTGLDRLLMGSTSQAISLNGRTPVLVVPAGPQN